MNANEHLKLERESTATLQRTVEEFEELLREKTAELVALSDDTQRANHDIQRHKETVFDLETKLYAIFPHHFISHSSFVLLQIPVNEVRRIVR